MKYLVAVSGGVDSVVLLDMLARAGRDVVVAHFDHGIRSDSAADARFVEALAGKYGVPFVGMREELGAGASEERARTRRYAFLRREAARHDAQLVTAHHADDVVETIAINLSRGTGWRGLAVLDSPDIVRPMLDFTKAQIYQYALHRHLEWVEDSTNATPHYLRNRIRRRIALRLPDEDRQKLVALWQAQLGLKKEIDKFSAAHAAGEQRRYFFTTIDEQSAYELLRSAIVAKTGASPTRPQTERALLAVKTARGGTIYDVGDGVRMRFTQRTFIVETSDGVV